MIIELPEMNLAYLRLARRAHELAQPHPEVHEALETFLETFPSLYGIGEWLDIWDQVWEDHGEVYQKIAELRNAASLLVVDIEPATESTVLAADVELLRSSSVVIEEHRRLKATRLARLFGQESLPKEVAGLFGQEPPPKEAARPARGEKTPPEQPVDTTQESGLTPQQRALVLEHLFTRLLALLSTRGSGDLLVQHESANQIYLHLRRWAEQLVEGQEALRDALAAFLSAYPNLYEVGDDEWELSYVHIAPLKARISEALNEAGTSPSQQLPSEWVEYLDKVDRAIEAFAEFKRKATAQHLKLSIHSGHPEAVPLRPVAPQLSLDEAEAVARHRFKSDQLIEINGTPAGEKGNVVLVNGVEAVLDDASFVPFLRLVLALYESEDGYLSRKELRYGSDLDGELALMPQGFDQALHRIRRSFQGRIGRNDPKEFIQVERGKVRLSTYHRFVVVDCETLLRHEDPRVRGLAQRIKSQQTLQA